MCFIRLSPSQIDYLRSYGYLPSTASRFGADILHEDTAKAALKALQVSELSRVYVHDRKMCVFLSLEIGKH